MRVTCDLAATGLGDTHDTAAPGLGDTCDTTAMGLGDTHDTTAMGLGSTRDTTATGLGGTRLGPCPDAPPEQLVVWDSGGGSFQVTTLYKGDVEMYGAAVGSSVATVALVEAVQGHPYAGQSPNPCCVSSFIGGVGG